MRVITEIHHLKRGDLIAVIDAKGLAERGLGAGETLKEVFQYDIEHNTCIVYDRSGEDNSVFDDADPPALGVRYQKPRPGSLVRSDTIWRRRNGHGFWLASRFWSEVKYILLLSSADDPDLSIAQCLGHFD
tara:strand:- start:94 stop:486 length:393 start_codon:yes stop_codon:yes gene_type:complete